jgi:hypothetical protein
MKAADPLKLVALLALTTMCGRSTTDGTPTGLPTNNGDVKCSAAQGAAFAWWVGGWNYAVPGFDPGVTTVTTTNGSCSLKEEFVDIHNMQAHTSIQYDSTAKQWKRTVTDPFRTYNSAGTFAADGSIAFYENPGARETYRPVDHDHVDFRGESSADSGKTWKLLFDATYTRRP